MTKEDWKIFWMFVGIGLGWYVGALLSMYFEVMRKDKNE